MNKNKEKIQNNGEKIAKKLSEDVDRNVGQKTIWGKERRCQGKKYMVQRFDS